MILMNDFNAEPAELRKAMLDAAKRVIDSGWYVLGNEVINFEKQWAELCGMNYAVGLGNGMDAIEIALRSLEIGPGDEVITTSMTAFATVLAILRAGATPVLADIEDETALLSKKSVLRCISSKTKAMVLVHLYGQVCDMSNWQKLCADNNIYLIEDCAQSHLAELNGKFAGSFGDAGAYSFYPTKNLGAIGDAGALVTNNEAIAERASKLRNYGQSVRYHHPELGMNSRLDEIHAAMLSERLKWLVSFTERRREIADQYRAGIYNNKISLLSVPQERSAHAYHLFVVKTSERDALQKHLQKNDVQSLIHYPIPIHHQDSCRGIKIDPKGLIESELHATQCLSIPCHPHMTNTDVEQVINSINSFGI
jgi:dTDP-4-amino-4,6-dideoxygalactose transaminase